MSEETETPKSVDIAGRLDGLVGLVYSLRREVDAAVEENFGYAPTDALFDSLMYKLRLAENRLKLTDAKSYEEYEKKYY